METKLQAAQKLRDSLILEFVELEVEVRYLRLEGKNKEKDEQMLNRDNISLRISLLDAYIKEMS